MVLELLTPHGVANNDLQLTIIGAIAERAAKVGLVEREQARPEPAVGGQADAVAVPAERLGDRIDEPDQAVAVGEPVQAGRCARFAGLGFERIDLIDRRPDLSRP